jgi:hypothetical protein
MKMQMRLMHAAVAEVIMVALRYTSVSSLAYSAVSTAMRYTITPTTTDTATAH